MESEIPVLYLGCTFTLWVRLELYFRINKYLMRNVLYHVKAGLLSRGLCHQTYPTTRKVSAQVWGKIRGEKRPLLRLKIEGVQSGKASIRKKVMCCTLFTFYFNYRHSLTHAKHPNRINPTNLLPIVCVCVCVVHVTYIVWHAQNLHYVFTSG